MFKNCFILVLILLSSFITSVFCQGTTLTAIDITEGEYAGYQMLKGYENEDLYRVYFKDHSKDNITSYQVIHENLKKVDMNEVITFEYRGERRQSTSKQLYQMFNEASKLHTFKTALDDREFSQTWFSETFGEVYQDWFDDGLYSEEAGRLVEQYFRQDELPQHDRFILSEIVIE